MGSRVLRIVCVLVGIVSVAYAQKCVHKLDGESGKIIFPISRPASNLPTFALKDEKDLSKRCVFFKRIGKKKLSIKLKKVDLKGGTFLVQTIKSNPKSKWKTFKKISDKTKQKIVNMKGFEFVRITVDEKSATFEMEYGISSPPVVMCPSFDKSVNVVKCSKGTNVGSKCALRCKNGFVPSQKLKINMKKKFTATCRKVTGKKGVWKASLNSQVCGKGNKKKKVCKTEFQLCEEAKQTSKPQSTTKFASSQRTSTTTERATTRVETTFPLSTRKATTEPTPPFPYTTTISATTTSKSSTTEISTTITQTTTTSATTTTQTSGRVTERRNRVRRPTLSVSEWHRIDSGFGAIFIPKPTAQIAATSTPHTDHGATEQGGNPLKLCRRYFCHRDAATRWYPTKCGSFSKNLRGLCRYCRYDGSQPCLSVSSFS